MLSYNPLLWSGVALSARCAKTVPTAASFLSSQSACRRLLLQSPAFLFSRLKFDFPRFGCRLYDLLKNYPIPQEVKGYADGDSLRQLFSFSGLTFMRMRGIVRWHPFGNRCRTCSNFAGGFAHVSTGFFRGLSSGNRKRVFFEAEI